MTDLARQFFTVTRHAYDSRADRRCRTVHMSMTQVTIERVFDGIKMSVAVPVAAYQALTIRIQSPSGTAVLTLSHGSDSDLDIFLASGEAKEVTIAAKAWGAVLEKPILVQSGAAMLPPQPRSSPTLKVPRRRASGDVQRMKTRFAGEREIIART